MNYTVFNITSKEIVRTGVCSADEFALQAGEGHGVLEGNYSNLNFYVCNNTVIPYTSEQVELKAKQPILRCWSNETFNWINPRTEAQQYNDAKYSIILQRNALLRESDWTQLPDVPLSTKEAWATYRQALRDITQQADPFNITWPTPPQ